MKIICIGRNYVDHAKELNNPIPQEPIFFLKPETALLRNNRPFFYPNFSTNIAYEVELVYRICRVGKNISERFAHRYYDAVGIGIDFTARDLQQQCKERGLPWEMAKAFDNSAPISKDFLEFSQIPDSNAIFFSLEKNGIVVQRASNAEMIFSIDKLIAYVSKFVMLKIGDLIFTGTPAGVGSVAIGDTLKAYIGDKLMLSTKIC
jgi:2-keto-4-pentenoate hydratase/2-oxohepta-3-ene-1,7-dioic acid hydratase in catechol pathway